MNTNSLMEPKPPAKAKLRCFTLYADFPAGIRAKRLVSRVTAGIDREWSARGEMWKLDSVAPNVAIRDMIAQEAGESDVLLIAISAVDQPEPALIQWLSSVVNWKLNRTVPGLLAGLPGDEYRRADQSNWLVQELGSFARRTRMDFVWHAAGNDAVAELEWLAAAVDRLLERKKRYAAATVCTAGIAGVTAG